MSIRNRLDLQVEPSLTALVQQQQIDDINQSLENTSDKALLEKIESIREKRFSGKFPRTHSVYSNKFLGRFAGEIIAYQSEIPDLLHPFIFIPKGHPFVRFGKIKINKTLVTAQGDSFYPKRLIKVSFSIVPLLKKNTNCISQRIQITDDMLSTHSLYVRNLTSYELYLLTALQKKKIISFPLLES